MPTVPVEYLWLAAALVAAGVISGFLAGFFGIGGGAPIVFALYETFRALGVSDAVRMHICIGSALAVMVPTAVVSYLGHRKRGSVDDTIAKAWALPVVLGVAAGSGVAAVASQAALKLVFAVLAALNGVKMLSNRLTWRLGRDTPTLPETAAAGFVTGLLSSLMGIGGGVFGNMFLSLYGRPMHQVVGTSASLGVLIGVAGTIGYMVAGLPHEGALPFGSIGFVSLPALLLVAPLAALCAPLGVRIAHRFSPQRLKQAFGVFLLVLSARFWASLAFGV